MSHPVGYYVGHDTFFDQLQDRYGAQLQQLDRQQKLTFRGTLAAFLCQQERNKTGALSSMPVEQRILEALEGVDADIWDTDQDELIEFIKRAASLSVSDIEGLIACLSEGLRYA